jgi:hypothetical protein
MERQAVKLGSRVQLWRVSFEPIPSTMWTATEIWTLRRPRWQTYTDHTRALDAMFGTPAG